VRVWQQHIVEKALNALFLSFVNSLLFHYKRHNQNKADSTVDKNRDFFKLASSELDLKAKNALCFDDDLSLTAWFQF